MLLRLCRFEWNLITEEGAKLKPVQGPGLVGLRNIGNSCYFNSVIQVHSRVVKLQAAWFST